MPKISKLNFLISILVFLFFFKFALAQKSASLFLSPSTGNYRVNQTFTVSVLVRSEQQPMNAAEGTIRYDPTIIRVTSISKSGSIFSLWPEEPNYSNSNGTIKFVGGSPTSYQGSAGKIFTITFQALKEGTASINFVDGKVLAADGLGTDITDKLSGATFVISPVQLQPSPLPSPEEPIGLTPAPPQISSPTHPDPEKWYNNKNPKLVWEVPEGILAIRTLLGKIATAQPTVVYEPPISSKEFENLDDGIWYFSLQFKNQYGWGKISRFKIQIDTVPPKDFTVGVDNEGDPTNPTPIFQFETTDELSGIDYYEIILNGKVFSKVKPEEIKNGKWKISQPLEPGTYSLEIKAVDRAGNFTLAKNEFDRTLTSFSFIVEPLPLEVLAFPEKIKAGNPLIVRGKTASGAKVLSYIQKDGQITTKETKIDPNGNFQLEEILPVGEYLIWFQAQDQRGRVGFSQKYKVEIVKDKLGFYLLIFLLILILLGLIVIFYLLRKIQKEREKIKKLKLQKMKEEKLRAYLILREKVQEQIKYLEGKVDLSRSETKILEALKEALKEAEKERSKLENQENL